MNARELLALLERESVRSGRSGRHYDAVRRELTVAAIARADPATRRFMESNLESVDSTAREYAPRLPTPDQSLHDYVRLEDSKARLDLTLTGGAPRAPFPPRMNVVLGTVETNHLNALSTHCAEPDEYLIALNRALLNACLRLCNYLTSCFTMSSATAGHARSVLTAQHPADFPDPDRMWPVDGVERDAVTQLAPAYRDLLTAVIEARLPDPRMTISFVAHGRPEDADENRSRDTRWTLMEDCVTDFIVGHEYAHILLDHLTRLDESPTEEHGGWGHEYHADSVGLDLLVNTWANRVFGDRLIMSWVLQSLSLFFVFLSQIERYSAEILRRTDGVWRDNRSHPPTWLRYRRLFWQISRYEFLNWPAIEPHLRRVEEYLEQMYLTAVGDEVARSAATLEWRFQRLAFGSIDHGLYPQQLVVAARALKYALDSGASPDKRHLESCAAAANRDLDAHAVRPLAQVTQPLEAVASRLGDAALDCSRLLGGRATVQSFADELERVMLRDARERYGRA